MIDPGAGLFHEDGYTFPGDKITHWNDLIPIFQMYDTVSSDATTPTSAEVFKFWPTWSSGPFTGLNKSLSFYGVYTSITDTDPFYRTAWIDFLCTMYSIWRGSYHLKFISTQVDEGLGLCLVKRVDKYSSAPAFTPSYYKTDSGTATIAWHPYTKRECTVTLPWSSEGPFVLTNFADVDEQFIMVAGMNFEVENLYTVWIAAGDDFMYSGLFPGAVFNTDLTAQPFKRTRNIDIRSMARRPSLKLEVLSSPEHLSEDEIEPATAATALNAAPVFPPQPQKGTTAKSLWDSFTSTVAATPKPERRRQRGPPS